MPQFDGRRVSRQWHRVLTEARKQGVKFLLTSGRRTMAEQRALFANPPRDKFGNPVPVAKPSRFAPHIRVGSPAHALDVNSLDGGETRLERWVESQGADWRNTVAGEAWHGELTALELARLSRKIRLKNQREARAAKRKREAARRRARREEKARRENARFVDLIFNETERLDLPGALGLALIEQESGFRNVWGGDRAPNGDTTGLQFEPVTEARYKRYLKARGPQGKGGMQGVGPAQLTWWEFQDKADARGGCWKPEHNIAVGLEILAGHIKRHGKRKGLAVYNGGAKNPNFSYADQVLSRERKWKRVLR